MNTSTRGGKKGRKIGRNKKSCELYRAQHRRERNKIRKIKKYLKRHPNDKQAAKRAEVLAEQIRG